jgi:hypothetical protein
VTYEDFITEVRGLARTGSELLDAGVRSHEDRGFRRWRHTAESLVKNIQRQGVQLPGPFNSHVRLYRATWVNARREDDATRFANEMNDSLIELQYLLDHFEKYGAPDSRPTAQAKSVGATRQQVETVSEPSIDAITLAWLWKHVPLRYWGAVVALAAVIFYAGFLAGRNQFFQKAYDLVHATFVGGQ